MPAHGALAHVKQGVGLEVALASRALHPVDQGEVEGTAASRASLLLLTNLLLFQQPFGTDTHPLAELTHSSQRASYIRSAAEYTTLVACFAEEVCEARIAQSVREFVTRARSEVARGIPWMSKQPQPKILMKRQE